MFPCWSTFDMLIYNPIMNKFRTTGIVLIVISFFLVILSSLDKEPQYIPFIAAYLLASKNPWRYRIVVNTGLLLHFILILNYFFRSATTANLFLNVIFLFLLLIYYPSPYPLWMNITAFLFSTESNVDWIEKHPRLFKWLSRYSIIGSILGLYYNSQSFNIIQEEGFLGFSPVKDILALAKRAGVMNGALLLEIGSGLGGPICAIAGEYKINAVGLDLLRHHTEYAQELARRRNLKERVNPVQGDGLYLPFRNDSFDFVFGSDAWVHIPDRALLLKEVARVLKRGGIAFFYDWLDTGGVSEGFRFIYAFPPLEKKESYLDKLKAAGFEIQSAEFDTEHYIEIVEKVKNSVLKNKRRIIEECGRELYDNWLIVVEYTLKMLFEKKLGHGFFIAKKVL